MAGNGSSRVADRYALLMDLFAAGEEIMQQNLRRRAPGASDDEIEEALVAWLQDRPGASCGDAEGIVARWPRWG